MVETSLSTATEFIYTDIMLVIILSGLFLAEFLMLLLLSRFLTRCLSKLFYALTKSRRVTIHLLAFLFWPGTIVHELSHLLVAGMLFVPVGEMEIWPQIDGDNVRFGSVEIGKTDMLRRSLIGVAPILVGLSLVLGMMWVFKENFLQQAQLWQILLLLYIIFQISNTMFSSKKDMEGAALFFGAVFIVFIIFGLALYFTGFVSFSLLTTWDFSQMITFLKTASVFLVIPISLDLLFLILAQFLPK